jgi:hypothetical protein
MYISQLPASSFQLELPASRFGFQRGVRAFGHAVSTPLAAGSPSGKLEAGSRKLI